MGEELKEDHTLWAQRILPFDVASGVQSWVQSTEESGEEDGKGLSHLTTATKTQRGNVSIRTFGWEALGGQPLAGGGEAKDVAGRSQSL